PTKSKKSPNCSYKMNNDLSTI
uniref:Uncharacterized protein n=1 Tax=Solanum lycopersicum TaxID=4081 RepID=A0A3Q7GE51_SOLLC